MADAQKEDSLLPLFDPVAFPAWSELLFGCEAFARLSGGRYTRAMFENLQGDDGEQDQARLAAMPIVADFAGRLSESGKKSEDYEQLLQEFRGAEVMVIREAVFCSMVATCRSIGLWHKPAKSVDVAPDDVAYQDTSEPLECIAGRLFNFVHWRRSDGLEEQHKQRTVAACFVVEFGREHGLSPSSPDAAAERMLMEFLQRLKEWGERSGKKELTPCFEDLPEEGSLRKRAETWWRENWKGVALGAGIFVGAAAVVGAGWALYSAAQNSRGGGDNAAGRACSKGRGRGTREQNPQSH